MRNLPYISGILFLVFLSCRPGPEQNEDVQERLPTDYASHFHLSETKNGYIINVTNPYQGAEGESVRYDLSRGHDKNAIPIPVKRIACMSTTHVAFIDALGMQKKIKGVSTADYIYSPKIRDAVASGHIRKIGTDKNLNMERIIALNPDLLFAYSVDNSVEGNLQQIREAGIPVVMVAEYLENHPLGRAEWLRFFACFFDCLPKADSVFKERVQAYTQMRDSTEVPDSLRAIFNLPWKGVWWMPGGDSYMSHLAADAGISYVFSDRRSPESIVVDMESAYNASKKADIWLHTGAAQGIADIIALDQRLGEFPLMKNGRIYNNNKRANSYGNDFYESGVVFPDSLLRDLILIQQGDKSEESLVYYKKLQ